MDHFWPIWKSGDLMFMPGDLLDMLEEGWYFWESLSGQILDYKSPFLYLGYCKPIEQRNNQTYACLMDCDGRIGFVNIFGLKIISNES